MSADKEFIKKLIDRYIAGEASEKELQAFFGLLSENEIDKFIYEHMDKEILHSHEEQPIPTPIKRFLVWKYAAVISGFLLLSYSGYYIFHNKKNSKNEYANDIAPGSGKPYLTLANGQRLVLGNNHGVLAKQGSIIIHQDSTDKVSYTANNAQITDAPYNTLTNPRGGNVVSLILPDGTLVKLEAESSITYQTAFTGKSRNVTTTGKVYFAVNHNKDKPFYVSTKGQVTEDLGTQFIVEAFDDEQSIKTTLIAGSILVSKDGHKVLIKPGQQTLAAISLKAQPADIDHEMDWINGDFDFNNQDLHSIMRELARVYNIDVSYKGDVENMVLNGMISRSHNISVVLKMFEATNNVHFEINGRRIMVIAGQ